MVMRVVLYLFLLIFLGSCKTDAELSMERGIHYYEWKMYNEAILEFNQAKYSQLTIKAKSYDDIKLLARCHYNLAITYAKMELFSNAMQEAQQAYNLIPNKEYRELITLVQQQLGPS
tara:strand:- start:132 stop:482 length:351 start_codon:yes stop_codon:yes gene_type:complete